MPGSKHSVLGIIQVTIDKIIVSITGFTTIDHRGTIALDEKLLNPTISQVTGSRINIKGKKGILDPVNNCQSIFVHIPADTRSAFPVISVQSPVSIQCCWQS